MDLWPLILVCLETNSTRLPGDFSLDDLPLKADVWSAVSEDPAAEARAFQRFVEYLINHVIGVDPKTQQTAASGGVFGKVDIF
jgi:hypothetical protein